MFYCYWSKVLIVRKINQRIEIKSFQFYFYPVLNTRLSQVTFLSPQLLLLQTAMVWWVLHAELLSVTRGPSSVHLCVRCTGPRRGSGTWSGPWPATRGRTSRSTPPPARATATTTAGGSKRTLDKGLTRLCYTDQHYLQRSRRWTSPPDSWGSWIWRRDRPWWDPAWRGGQSTSAHPRCGAALHSRVWTPCYQRPTHQMPRV